jgi:hypothetical protein
MYAPVATGEGYGEPTTTTSSGATTFFTALIPSWRFLFSLVMLTSLVGGLAVTYDSCVGCVVAVAVLSLLLLSVVPLMPVVLLVSLGVLFYHAVDYRTATVRVEVPLQNLVYVPTYDDFRNYVHMTPSAPPNR